MPDPALNKAPLTEAITSPAVAPFLRYGQVRTEAAALEQSLDATLVGLTQQFAGWLVQTRDTWPQHERGIGVGYEACHYRFPDGTTYSVDQYNDFGHSTEIQIERYVPARPVGSPNNWFVNEETLTWRWNHELNDPTQVKGNEASILYSRRSPRFARVGFGNIADRDTIAYRLKKVYQLEGEGAAEIDLMGETTKFVDALQNASNQGAVLIPGDIPNGVQSI